MTQDLQQSMCDVLNWPVLSGASLCGTHGWMSWRGEAVSFCFICHIYHLIHWGHSESLLGAQCSHGVSLLHWNLQLLIQFTAEESCAVCVLIWLLQLFGLLLPMEGLLNTALTAFFPVVQEHADGSDVEFYWSHHLPTCLLCFPLAGSIQTVTKARSGALDEDTIMIRGNESDVERKCPSCGRIKLLMALWGNVKQKLCSESICELSSWL